MAALSPYPVFIPIRDRVEPLLLLIEWLELAQSTEIWLIDNASTYPPMLELLASTPHHVVRTGMNLGHRSPWLTGTVQRVSRGRPFVVSDPDIVPDASCPLDAVDHFATILERHPDLHKVGFGLRIDDLPDHYPLASHVRSWEAQFWEKEIEPGLFSAPIDTTFALYRPLQGRHDVERAARTGFPYVAAHIPWYSDPHNLSEDEIYYRKCADPTISNWNRDVIPRWKQRRVRDHSA